MSKTNRITICHDDDLKELFDLIKKKSKNRDVIGKLAHGLLKEGLYGFLDYIDCDLTRIDGEVNRLMKRTNTIYFRMQLKQAVKMNQLKGGDDED